MLFQVINDNSVDLAQAFGLTDHLHENELYFSVDVDSQKLIFLDSASSSCSIQQLDWLDAQISKKIDPFPLVIFIHHPPCFAGVPFMDNRYAFNNQGQFQQRIKKVKGIVPVFSGHYHVEKSILVNNVLVHITPSCFFQIDQNTNDFMVDHYRIGFRLIVFTHGKLYNSVHYTNGSRLQ